MSLEMAAMNFQKIRNSPCLVQKGYNFKELGEEESNKEPKWRVRKNMVHYEIIENMALNRVV